MMQCTGQNPLTLPRPNGPPTQPAHGHGEVGWHGGDIRPSGIYQLICWGGLGGPERHVQSLMRKDSIVERESI
jgi:hypothetical protein